MMQSWQKYVRTSVYFKATVFNFLFCYEVWWFYGCLFSSYSIFIKSIRIIFILKKCSLSKINTFLETRILATTILKQLLYSDSNLEYIWVCLSRLLLRLKSPSLRGHLTIQLLWVTTGLLVTHFIVLSTQWIKELRTWGQTEISSYCFFVWIQFIASK